MKKLLTIKEVSIEMGLSEDKIRQLVSEGRLSAYRIGGSLLRFDFDQIKEAANSNREKKIITSKAVREKPRRDARPRGGENPTIVDKIVDYVKFNDFYFLCALFIVVLALIIFR